MINHTNSSWGIKDSNTDITSQIMGMINNANQFIIVCGYNFTFTNQSRPVFDALKAKLATGVQCLMIFPPRLFGSNNPQPKIINHCLANNIPVMLNHLNHSKWLLTDEDIYYGSSNFSKASWKQKVEVVSLHKHRQIGSQWSKNTISDFKAFIQKEVATMNIRARRMKTYWGLRHRTQNAWNKIKPLVQKLNPSIEKVILTLNNYDEIVTILSEEVVTWFESYDQENFELIYKLSSIIMNSVDRLCEYAYSEIYNESIDSNINEVKQSVIDEYNNLYYQVGLAIDNCIEQLLNNTQKEMRIISDWATANRQKINSIVDIIGGANNNRFIDD